MKIPFETALYGTFRQLPGRSRILFLLAFFLLNILTGWGQNPAAEVPKYNHFDNVHMVTAGANNPDDIIISIATDSQGYIYTLSFGNGVDKRRPDGSLLQAEFIPANQFQTPLDIVINSKDEIFIADYFESGSCLDNGKIKVFDSNGVFKKNIAQSYFRPLGLALDNDDNIYIAEYYDGSTCENGEESRIRVFDSDGNYLKQTESVEIPYRLAVDSLKNIYVSQAGNNDNPQVLIFDANLNLQGNLPNITSPGSIVVDKFDFIHVIDYEGYVDFKEFLNYENADIVSLALGVLSGMGEFNIRIFSNQGVLEDQLYNEIRFPIDLIFNSDACDSKLFINNSDFNIIFPFENSTIEFDLEIYTRTPSFDDEAPIAQCIPDGKEFTLQNGKVTLTDDVINDGSTDNCGIKSYSLSQYEFTTAGVYPVTLTVTDEAGNTDSCDTEIKVVGAAPPQPIVTCPENSALPELPLDANCDYQLPVWGDLITTANFTPTFKIVNENEVNNKLQIDVEVLNGTDLIETCSLEFDLVDNIEPLITSCLDDEIISLAPGETYTVPNYQSMIGISDNCDSDPEYSQTPIPGTKISESTPVNITVIDAAGNPSEVCSFEIIIKEKEVFAIECKETYTVELGLNESAVSIPTEEFVNGDTSGIDFELIEQYFDCSDIGTFPLSINAKNSQTGETASCTVEVTVLDKGAPLLICQAPTLQYSFPAGGSFEVPNLYENRVIDNCDDLEDLIIVQNPPVGTEWKEPGTYTVTYSATDTYDNFSDCTVTIELSEEQGPFITCPNENDIAPIILDENCDFEEPDYTSDVGTGNFTNSPTITQTLQRVDNTLEVEIEVFDGQDYIGTCNFSVDIIDASDPEIVCPANISKEIPSEENSAIINYTPPQVQDNCDNDLQMELIAGYESGEVFPLGSTTVTWRVTDDSGNESECSFIVLITRDDNPGNTPPVAEDESYNIDQDEVFNLPAPGVLENDTDADGDDLFAELIDGVQNGTFNLSPDGSFSYTPDAGFFGTDSFTYVASDGTDDSNLATVTINVNSSSTDFSCRETPFPLQLNQSGAASLQLTDLYTGDASGLNLVASQLEFTCDDLGENSIELSWTGQSRGSCEITVMVEDNIKPVAEVSFISVTLDENGLAEIMPEELDNGSYDNCGELNFSLSKTRFTCEDTGQNTVALTLTDASGNSTTVNTIVFVNANPGTCSEPARDNDYLFLYPNPSDGLVKISPPWGVTVDQVFVFDKRGRFILSKDFDKSDPEYGFRLDGVQNAVYTLRILTSEGEIIRRLIIRN